MEHSEANDQFDTQGSRIELPVSFSQIIWSSNENKKYRQAVMQLRRIHLSHTNIEAASSHTCHLGPRKTVFIFELFLMLQSYRHNFCHHLLTIFFLKRVLAGTDYLLEKTKDHFSTRRRPNIKMTTAYSPVSKIPINQ